MKNIRQQIYRKNPGKYHFDKEIIDFDHFLKKNLSAALKPRMFGLYPFFVPPNRYVTPCIVCMRTDDKEGSIYQQYIYICFHEDGRNCTSVLMPI